MSLRVLVADPDWKFAGQVTQYLESRAHLVVNEFRTKEAKTQTEHWRPDLVILATEIANKGLLADVMAMSPRPAVLLTGWMDRYDQAWQAWQKGGDELLMKPVFHAEEVQEAIVTALENAAAGVRHKKTTVAASA